MHLKIILKICLKRKIIIRSQNKILWNNNKIMKILKNLTISVKIKMFKDLNHNINKIM